MTFVDIAGWIGAGFWTVCGLPQAYRCFKTKSAKGLSGLYLSLWWLGFIGSLIYIIPQHRYPILINYLVGCFNFTIMSYYKIKDIINERS